MKDVSLKAIRLRQERRRQALRVNLDRIVRQLEAMGALKVILFGSYARGRVRSTTDLDLICVMPSTRSGREWMRMIYDEIDRDVDCDILAYTGEELERMRPVSRFVRHALATGKTVYERRSEE